MLKIIQINNNLIDCFFNDEWDRWIRYNIKNNTVVKSNIHITPLHIESIKKALKEGKK